MPVCGHYCPAGKIRRFARVLWPRKSVSVVWWRITRESRSPVQARTRDLDNLHLASTVRPGSTPVNLVPRSSGRNSRLRTALSTLGRSTLANRRTPAVRHKDRRTKVRRRRARRTKAHSTRARSTRARSTQVVPAQVVPVLAARSTWEAGLRLVSLVVPA